MRILIVEDEPKVGEALQAGLEHEGYSVAWATTGEEGYFLAGSQRFDVVVLDLMLPGRDGLEVLEALRRSNGQTPVILLTARDAVEDRVRGLDAGADDYLVKPFAFAELLARIRSVLRRGRTDQVLRMRADDLEMDLLTRRATRAGEPLSLTAREYELLEYLLRNQGHVVSRDMLARDVWKEADRATPLDNVIDVHVNRLRKKIDEPFGRKLLHTVRGVGFVLRAEIGA